jgi:hypothetical protein
MTSKHWTETQNFIFQPQAQAQAQPQNGTAEHGLFKRDRQVFPANTYLRKLAETVLK